VGMKVYCKTELTQINGRELIFSVMASDEQGEIGRGIHHRFIVNRDKFMQKLSGK
ncbi:MAG: thioesterase, partial [Bacteroidales bacterium]|nr:thioesterase [Bacteroidales bacterium]